MMGIGKWFGILGLVIGIVGYASTAQAQSFNIDLDNEFASPPLGGGAPSSSFGAAANVAGLWNRISAGGQAPSFLRNLNGSISSVLFTGPNGGIGNGFNNPNVTGDYALLLNDGRAVGDDTWTFSGLSNGRYKLITYSVHPSGIVTNTSVTVAGADIPIKIVSGPIAGNQFIEGQTHSIHDVLVSNGLLSVRMQQGATIAYGNGFQLVAVPEPSLLLTLGLGSLLIAKRKQKR